MSIRRQPLPICFGQLLARPIDGGGGVRIKAFEIFGGGTIFVVIAFDAGNVHVANNIQTLLWAGVVSDDIMTISM